MFDRVKNTRILSVYDFDGTICFSPTPEIGKEIWKNVTGFEYPFKSEDELETKEKFTGWWGKLESLDPDVFDVQLNPKVMKALLEDIENEDVYTVLLTGRLKNKKVNFEPYIKRILDNHGVGELDEYLLCTGGGTLPFKLKQLDRLKSSMKMLEHVIMWEDRVDHIPHFQEWGKENMGDEFTLHIIK
jgi:hypothetical protein